MEIPSQPAVAQNPQLRLPRHEDLILPEQDAESVPTLATYKVPEEFWDAKAQRWRLDEQPKFARMFGSVEQFFQGVFSLGSTVPKPRNTADLFRHPVDYIHSEIEKNIAEQAEPDLHPSVYVAFDEEWKNEQVLTTAASVTGAFVLSVWAGSRNVDGPGRRGVLHGERDIFNGRRGMGSLSLTGIMYSIFMAGCTLASGYRVLRDEDFSPAEAYFLSAFPLTGIPLTLWDEKNYFPDYVHANFLAGALSMLYSQYLSRFAGIVSILSYARLWPDDLLATFERHMAATRVEQFGRIVPTANTTRSQTLLGELTQEYQGQAGIERVQREQRLLQEKRVELERGKSLIEVELKSQPRNAYLISRLGSTRRNLRHFSSYQKHLSMMMDKLHAGETIRFARELEVGQVRALTRQPARHIGQAIGLLEELRNDRLRFTPAEHLAMHRHGRLGRVGYGMISGFTHGRWRVRVINYGVGSVVGWLAYAVIYHYQWGKSWSESFLSSASFFYTLPLNEPVIGMLKGAGVQRIPYVMQYLPSAIAANGVQSALVWGNDIMLQRCKFERSNLLRSLDPAWRAAVRKNLARWYRLASEQERAQWTLPLEDGGCGLPVPGA